MIDKGYYKCPNVNDNYEIKQEVLEFLEELNAFDSRIKKFLGPNKIKEAGVDCRRSCRKMEIMLKSLKKKLNMTTQDYNSNYEDE